MRCEINGKEFIFPSSLSEITLGQRIAFQEQHGAELDEIRTAVYALPEGIERDFEIAEFNLEKAYRTVAFFAGVEPAELKASSFVDQVADIYFANEAVLFDDEQSLDFQYEHAIWNQLWVIQNPEIKQGTPITFGEFLDSKQIIQSLSELGKNKWEKLLPLCAIYLRKKDEPYDESYLYEGSERLQLMEQLPLNVALCVGFFLTGSLITAISLSPSSTRPSLNPAAMPKLTLSGGAGSAS